MVPPNADPGFLKPKAEPELQIPKPQSSGREDGCYWVCSPRPCQCLLMQLHPDLLTQAPKVYIKPRHNTSNLNTDALVISSP